MSGPAVHRHNNASEHNLSVSDSASGNASAMQKYFGPLRNSDIDTFASDAFAHETHNLPRAYEGRNKFLMATIDFLITKDDDWYTRHVLPWLYTEELHVKWNIWRFNRTMMDYEPEQGVPRYVSYESESRSDSLVRRGLAFIIEHGFYKTELGRQHYLMNLKQIVEAVHETAYFGVMHELLAAPNFYLQWQAKHGKSTSILSNDAVSALAEERWRFACVQKDIKGLFILDAEVKDRMRRVGIEPDAWIFPSKMAIYASMVPEYFTEFVRGGEGAASALEKGAKRFDTFRGSRVFETRPFDTDFMSQGAIEPLMRNREIGEFYAYDDFHDVNDFSAAARNAADTSRARFGIVAAGAAAGGVIGAATWDVTPFKGRTGIKIFDMARDKFHEIPYKEIVQKSWIGRNDDVVDALCDKIATDRGTCTMADLQANGFSRAMYAAAYARTLAELGAGATALLFAAAPRYDQLDREVDLSRNDENPLSLRTIAKYLYSAEKQSDGDAVLIIPHKFVMFRPRMTYKMGTAILLKGGEELGQTMHGHHDFQLTDDVIHKTHIGHYTFYSKSVVREPKNMYIADDIYCAGYNGGENTEFIQQNECDTQYSEPVDHESKSIIAIAVPADFDVPAVMSLTGSFHALGMTMRGNGDDGKYTTQGTIQDILGDYIGDHAHGSGSPDNEDSPGNAICFRGAEMKRHGPQGEFVHTQQNTGHWGPSVYDGCASVRQGLYAHLRPPGSAVAITY